MKKMPKSALILVCSGMLIAILPPLFKEYSNLPDFFWGFLTGASIGIEFMGLYVILKFKKGRKSENRSKIQEDVF